MIQRIQSVWLFLAALLNAGLFYFDLYTTHTQIAGVDTVQHIRMSNSMPLILIAIMMVALPLISIFLYKNRKQQRNVATISLVSVLSFISVVTMHVAEYKKSSPDASGLSYSTGAVLPFFSIILIVLAIRGISKDDKLVKSLDRLR